jgi:hypothetical protein
MPAPRGDSLCGDKLICPIHVSDVRGPEAEAAPPQTATLRGPVARHHHLRCVSTKNLHFASLFLSGGRPPAAAQLSERGDRALHAPPQPPCAALYTAVSPLGVAWSREGATGAKEERGKREGRPPRGHKKGSCRRARDRGRMPAAHHAGAALRQKLPPRGQLCSSGVVD